MTRDSFLRELGCFEGVNESKLGDRIGLAFSQTTPIDILSKDNIKLVPELFHNGYAFSDGCGVMGLNIALKIKEQYGLRHVPGAVQIRLGGIKVSVMVLTQKPASQSTANIFRPPLLSSTLPSPSYQQLLSSYYNHPGYA